MKSGGHGDAAGRVCWWCGGGPLTREHVIALWLREALHGDGMMDHSYAEPGAQTATRTWSKVEPDFVAKVVCAGCNSGWMSELEARVRPRLEGLMGGADRSLSRVDLQILARWSAKTALMFQALEPRDSRVIPAPFYAQLYEAEVLPPTIRVWAAKVEALGVFERAFAGEISHGGRNAGIFTSLVTLDRAAFMVMGCQDVGLLEAVELGHLSNAWVELGDKPSRRWPGPFVFDTENFAGMPQFMEQLVRIPPAARPGPAGPTGGDEPSGGP